MRARSGGAPRRAHPSLSPAMLLLLQPARARARQQGADHRGMVLGDDASRRDGHPASASLRRRAHRAEGSRADRRGRGKGRALYQSDHGRGDAQPSEARRAAEARPRSCADLLPGRGRGERRAHQRLSQGPHKEARSRRLGQRARLAAHHQRADPPAQHPQRAALHRACGEARRPAARNRPCPILRLGLSQPRGVDPDL